MNCKTLLAGVALCALATAPAMAGAPNIHLKAAPISSKATALHMSVGHAKTRIHDPHYINYTVTITVTGSLSRSYFLGSFHLLYAYAWTGAGGNSCAEFPNQTFHSTPKLTLVHKIKQGTTTGTCSGITNTYYGPNYKLLSSTATFDSFSGLLKAPKTSIGYNLKAKFPTSFGIY